MFCLIGCFFFFSFHQTHVQVEVLSCIRHPNMVLLLGACPEYGCLVYEYMGNGSLEDCLARRGGNLVLSWQLRFRIATEIGTGLLFLHQTKPEPLVHRDLKSANILLDHNHVSKISDVTRQQSADNGHDALFNWYVLFSILLWYYLFSMHLFSILVLFSIYCCGIIATGILEQVF